MTTITCLALAPRDGFFCKDGRGWHGSGGGAGHGLAWPWPSTVRGAIRSAWGRVHEALVARETWPVATAPVLLGRVLALRRRRADGVLERRWPVPADVEYVVSNDGSSILLRRLLPVPSPITTLGRDDDPARERLWIAPADDRVRPAESPRWWSEDALRAWLSESASAPVPASPLPRPALRRVTRAAIASATQTVTDGALFSHDVVETVETTGDWLIGAEVSAPDGEFASVATLGGDRRLARVDRIAAETFGPPPLDSFADAAGLRVLLVTPGIFGRGWLLDGFAAHDREYRGRLPGLAAELVLRAAMVPRPVPISGWDMAARAPRGTDLAVAPGAVYFLQRRDGAPIRGAELRALWLAAIGRRTDDGFGRVVAAPWTHTPQAAP